MPYARKIRSDTAEYKKAAAKILSLGDGGWLCRAAAASEALCLRARLSAKNIASYGEIPTHGGEAEVFLLASDFAENEREMSEEKLISFLASRGKAFSSVTLSLLPDALFAAAFARLTRLICEQNEHGIPEVMLMLEKLRFVDFTRIFLAFSVSVGIFSREKAGVFKDCDDKTKLKYISALVYLCKKEGRGEEELARELTETAEARNVHVGELLFPVKKYVGRVYAVCLSLTVLLVSLIYFLLCGRDMPALITLPAAAVACYGVAKEIFALCLRRAGGEGLMRMGAHVARGEKAVVAIMSILSGGESDGELFERLENFCISEENENRFYAVVCNLPDSKKRANAGDEKIISSAMRRIEALNLKYGNRFGIFVRERRYSRSERKYIGWERKRGAVLELCRFMRGEKTGISRYVADRAFLAEAKYLITLDADTNLYAGAADELVGTMLHPLNTPVVRGGAVVSGHAIVQPHIAPTLESSAASAFAGITSGNGGVDSYAGAAFDIYENIFGGGSFCGKGILDVDVFLEVCGDFFRNERVLSHDLLEGNLAGAAIASDITLTDSSPKNALAYYTRKHRWLRGDLQTIPYLFSHVVNARGEKIKNPMSALSKYKIADNVISALMPFISLSALFTVAFASPEYLISAAPFLLAGVAFPTLRSVISLFLPGEMKKAARRYRGRVIPSCVGGVYYSFYELCALPYEAALFADAAVRTAYRFLISKRNFLNWKTAAAAEKEEAGLLRYVCSMWFSFAAGALAFFTGELLMTVFGFFWLFFPFFAFLLSEQWGVERELSRREHAKITKYAEEMWGFFRDSVGESTNYLPPDNRSFSPTERVAMRTSPTNIGLYLTSLLGARDLSLITSEELCAAAEQTARTISRMAKWRGHLYNWYDIKTLEILGEPFVSTVDSGNLAVALSAFCEGLREYAWECPRLISVLRDYEESVKNMDFSALYNKSARLFHIGYDVRREKLSESFYDTFMSESRMASFFAVASGQVPREHFFAPSRGLVGAGAYFGVASWSGTAFEYFMPALFLPTVRDSLAAESLSFAYRMQKKNAVKRNVFGRRRKLFGVSESGYWHFDADMNYQYKAFGISELALDPEGRSAPVISPYSSFLMLRENPAEVLANLGALEKIGAHGEYGFFEAVDFDKSRVGEGFGIVKSYMAHHVGMSFIASVNMLKDDVFRRRFMRIPKMRAYRELLCEKIPVGAAVPPKRKRVALKKTEALKPYFPAAKSREAEKYNVLFPSVAMLSNNKLRLIASSSGHIAVYDGENLLFDSFFSRFSLGGGLRFYLWADGEVYPLVLLGARKNGTESEFSFEYNDERITYISRHKGENGELTARLTLSICPDRGVFSASCRVDGDCKNARLFVYGEPVLQNEKSFSAHKSFSALFLESKYFSGEEALVFARRQKNGGEGRYCLGVRAELPVYGGAFDTKRSMILPLMYSEEDIAGLAHSVGKGSAGAMIVPSLAAHTYRAGAKGACSFTFAAAQSEEEALFLLCEGKRERSFRSVCSLQYGASGFEKNGAFMKNLLLRSFMFPRGKGLFSHERYGRDLFWKHGISGENHMLLAIFPSVGEFAEEGLCHIVRLFKYMCICGERFDLVVIYDESDAYRGARRSKIEGIIDREGCRTFISREFGIHVISEGALTEAEKNAFLQLCELTVNLALPLEARNADGFFELLREAEVSLLRTAGTAVQGNYEAPADAVASTDRGDFTPHGFRVKKGRGEAPFAGIAYGEKLGFVATENSLGFTFFENAALGKLTPHTGDAMREDSGERLLLRVNGAEYDLCASAAFAEFGENKALYGGEAEGMAYTVEAGISVGAPIKQICVRFDGDAPDGAELVFAVVPCLGEKRAKAGRYIFERAENTLCLSTVFECPISLGITCGRKADFIFDEAELASFGRICGGESLAAAKRTLEKGEREVCFYLGAVTAEHTRKDFENLARAGAQSVGIAPIFENVKIKTESALFDLSVNRLFPYQTYYSRFMARTGFYQVGGAYGFRDQLQDSLSFIENAPELCRGQIILAAAHQYREGDVAHWWHSYMGRESGLRSRYSDDLLWLPFALCEYVEKTGDEALLGAEAPYLSSPVLDSREHERYEELKTSGNGTVLEHALLAASAVWSRGFGAHGLLKFGGGDWNDGMNLVGIKGEGESVWLTEFAAIVYIRLARLLERVGREGEAEFFRNGAMKLYEGFCTAFCDGWFLRGYYDSGEALGKKGNAECEIDALSQSFAVFAELELFGKVSERARAAILAAYERLFDKEYGIMKLLSPPFDNGGEKPGYIKGYLPGIRENGGQYTHAAVWAAMALMLAGEKEKGLSVLKAINPAVRSEEEGFCARYKAEPYALAGDVYSHPEHMGRGGWSHYTGSAAWYRKAVTETVFGLRLCGEGFRLEPNITEELDGAELALDIRSTRYEIRYFFSKETGIVLDGKIIETDGGKMSAYVFPFDGGEHTVDFCMRKRCGKRL